MQTLSFSQRLMETCTTELPTRTETKDVNLFASNINCNHDASPIGKHNNNNFYRTDDNIFSDNDVECEEQESNEELQERSEETYNLSIMPNRSQMHLRKEQEVHLTPRRAANHLLHSSASTFRVTDKEHEHKHRQLFSNNESKEEDASSFSEERTNEEEQEEEEKGEHVREQSKYKSSFLCLENNVENHNLFSYRTWPYLQNTLPQSLHMCDMYKSYEQMTNKNKNLSSRVRYHSERYGNFIRAYLKWSEDESRKACLKARNVSAVGIVRANRNKSALVAASSSVTTTNATSIAACDHITTRSSNNNSCNNGSRMNASKVSKIIMSTRYTSCAYKTSRPFRRHTALAVEGDALFAELIEYAHECFERKKSMAEHINTNKCKKWESHVAGARYQEVDKDVMGSSNDTEEECEQELSYCKKEKTEEQEEEYEWEQRELSKFTPNARCISIHYGISEPSTPESSHSCNDLFMEDYVQLSSSHYPRASLMAIIATTRLEKNTVIVVDIPSYYRCLNEGEWYRYVYSTSWHNRYNKLWSSNKSTEQENVENDKTCKYDHHHHHHHHHYHCKDSIVKEEKKEHEQEELSEKGDVVIGDVSAGVKVFARWPESIPFYHGVGEMHSTSLISNVNTTTLHKMGRNNTIERNKKTVHKAIASFPFTLVDLVHTPELGPNQMGLAAAMFIPYATCFLYTGPVMSTQQTERLLNHNIANVEAIKCNKREHCKKESACVGSNNEINSYVYDDKRINSNDKEVDVLDDTYALGLDNDNICFGQGLSRYINHRYNINRFGNCELCTILLSLPASVVKSKQEGTIQKATESKTRKNKRVKQPSVRHKKECDAIESNTHSSTCSSKESVVSEKWEHREQEEEEEKKFVGSDQNNTISNTSTHIPCNLACMLTIPFFLTTTDIYAGHSFLAWTYGEDYDAKLERIAVADNQIVPYCDSVLLNSRANHRDYCNSLSNNIISNDDDGNISKMKNIEMKFEKQRYGGDYRFALSTGDIVWRRRPQCTSTIAVRHFPQTSELQSEQYYEEEEKEEEEEEEEEEEIQLSSRERVAKCKLLEIEMYFDPEKYSNSVGISFAHPQYDLFQVMGVMKNGMEYLLLREIKPIYWSNGSNGGEVNVNGNNSEWTKFAKEYELECIAANHIANDLNLSEECFSSCNQVGSERHMQTNVDEWVFYRLHHAGNYRLAIELDKCVVASSDSVGLLLSGIDYHITHTAPKGNTWSGLTCAPHVIIYLPHLIHATSLVNHALVTCTQIEPEPSSLWSGLVWPLLEKCNSPHTIDEMLSIYCSSSEEDIRSECSDYWSDDSYIDDGDEDETEQICNYSKDVNTNEESQIESN